VAHGEREGTPMKLPKLEKGTKQVPMEVTGVFWKTHHCDNHTMVHRGGARSSKSYSISQFLAGRLVNGSNTPRRILVMRKTFPALRISIRPMIYNILQQNGLWDRVREDKQNNDLICGKAMMHFASLDKPEKVRSSEWNDIFLEEANEFTYEDYLNCALRMSAPDFGVPNKMFLALNPTDSFSWIKTKMIGPNPLNPLIEDVAEIHSTYRDNWYLPASYVKRLEALREQDPNQWKVFGEGEWGVLDNLVYTWWTEVPEPKDGEIYYGLDFGFVNESAVVECRQDGHEVYVIERLYKTGLTNSDLIQELMKIIPEDKRMEYPIYPDIAEPDRMKEIADAGFWVIPSEKDVLDGIDSVKRHHLNIVNGHGDSPYASPNFLKEIRAYSYRKNKEGVVLEEPVKYNDHLMSAVRYAIHTHNLNRSYMIRELDFDIKEKKHDPYDPWSDRGWENM
jgi:phage terminase large subunit